MRTKRSSCIAGPCDSERALAKWEASNFRVFVGDAPSHAAEVCFCEGSWDGVLSGDLRRRANVSKLSSQLSLIMSCPVYGTIFNLCDMHSGHPERRNYHLSNLADPHSYHHSYVCVPFQVAILSKCGRWRQYPRRDMWSTCSDPGAMLTRAPRSPIETPPCPSDAAADTRPASLPSRGGAMRQVGRSWAPTITTTSANIVKMTLGFLTPIVGFVVM